MLSISSVPVRGSTGPDVMVIQRALEAHGFPPGTIDGLYASHTAAAISKYQKTIGLPGSGDLGPKTLAGLGIQVLPVHPTGSTAITRPFPRKHSTRHLHPTLRLLMEAKIFPGGAISMNWKNHSLQQMVIETARGLNALGIVEKTGHNDGVLVGYIQAIIGAYTVGGNGDSWCESTDQCIIAFIEDFLGKESPVPSEEGVVNTWEGAVDIPGLTTKTFEVGTQFQGKHMNSKTGAGHTGTTLADEGENMLTFEGNRSNKAWIGSRSKVQTGDLKTLGFVRIFPNNKIV